MKKLTYSLVAVCRSCNGYRSMAVKVFQFVIAASCFDPWRHEVVVEDCIEIEDTWGVPWES